MSPAIDMSMVPMPIALVLIRRPVAIGLEVSGIAEIDSWFRPHNVVLVAKVAVP